jgi:hypothetical protein
VEISNSRVQSQACLEGGIGSTSCLTGYEGVACNEWSRNYVRLGTSCKKCLNGAVKWVIIICSAVLIVLVGRKLLNSKFRIPVIIRVSMSWFQILSLFPLLSDRWPETLKVFFNIATFSNLEIQFFGFDCDLNITFWFTWTLKLISPLIALGTFLVLIRLGATLAFLQSFPTKRLLFIFVSPLDIISSIAMTYQIQVSQLHSSLWSLHFNLGKSIGNGFDFCSN